MSAPASLRAKADSVPQRSFARVTKRAAVIGAPAGDGRSGEHAPTGWQFSNWILVPRPRFPLYLRGNFYAFPLF